MYSIIKNLFKVGLIGGLAVIVLTGGSLLLAGSDRTGAVLHDVQDKIGRAIDANIDDPAALRRELQKLGQEYPARITKVRKDLACLRSDITQLERDHAISVRVVELAEDDLASLAPALQEQQEATQMEARANLAAFVVKSPALTSRTATRRILQIQRTRAAHASRAYDAGQQLGLLRQQESQFEAVLHQLEEEQARFKTQLEQLNLQVDSIQRNERLIELLDRRKRTLEECRTYDLQTLDQLTGKLDQILTEQSVELELLTVMEPEDGYEQQAREQLEPRPARPQLPLTR